MGLVTDTLGDRSQNLSVERRQTLLKRLGNLRRIRSQRSLTVEELSKESNVPRSTIVGLEEGVRKAPQVTVDKLAETLDGEPSELANEEGITILEEGKATRLEEGKATRLGWSSSTITTRWT